MLPSMRANHVHIHPIECFAWWKPGFTGLMLSVVKGHIETVTAFLDEGDDPHMKTADGSTALSLATRCIFVNCVLVIVIEGDS